MVGGDALRLNLQVQSELDRLGMVFVRWIARRGRKSRIRIRRRKYQERNIFWNMLMRHENMRSASEPATRELEAWNVEEAAKTIQLKRTAPAGALNRLELQA